MRTKRVRMLGVLCGGLLLASGARGDTYEVTNNMDSGAGSLREAITLSNDTLPQVADTITFVSSITPTITMMSVYPDILGDLDIDGMGVSGLRLVGLGSAITPDLYIQSGTTAIRQIDLETFSLWINGPDQTAILDTDTGDRFWGGATAGTTGGALVGDGTLTKQGTGTLDLFVNGFFWIGKLGVDAGTLRTNVASIGKSTTITNAGELVFVETGADKLTDIRSVAGAISGTGSLVKEGDGASIWLLGANTFTGGITVRGGGVQGSTDSLGSGGVTFAPDSAERVGLSILQDVDGTLSGGVHGDGDLLKLGSGVVTLGGTVDYTGTTVLLGGGLVISNANLPGDIDLGTGTSIAFDQGSDGTLGGEILGDGSFEKKGSAVLTLAADSPSFTGTTSVSAGTLALGGIDFGTSLLDLASGATLSGTGRIEGSLTSAGLVDPGGADLGTLEVGGDVSMGSGAAMAVLVQETGESDRLDVDGTVTLDGPQLQLTVGAGTYGTPVDAVIVQSTSNILGSGFSALTDDLAFLDVSLVPGDDTNVTIRVEANANGFGEFAETPNQDAVAQVLDAVRPVAEGDMQNVLDAMVSLSVPEVPGALGALDGEPLTSFTTPRLAVERRLSGAIDGRMRGFAAGDPATLPPRVMRPSRAVPPGAGPMANLALLAGDGPPLATAPEPGASGFGAWLDGYGVLAQIEGGSPENVDYDIFGGSAGVDYRFGRRLLVGGAFGYAYTDIDLQHLAGSQHIDTYHGALYGTWAIERFHLGASAGFGYSQMESKRPITFGGLDRKAKADFDGWSASAHVESGYDVLSLWEIALQPLATFDYVHVQQDSFTEKNAGAASLASKSEDVDSEVTGLGARLHTSVRSDDGTRYTPHLEARWLHEFGDTDRRAQLSMTGAGDLGAFTVKGADVGRDALSAGVGYTVSLAGGLNLYAGYQVLWNPDILEHAFGGGLEIAW